MAEAATATFGSELANGDKAAPEWIELFPAGPQLTAVDGRKWTANPSAVLAAFAARNGRPLPVDYEHAQAIKAGTGDEAPAAGWIVAVEERAGAIWGKVEWTPRAARLIADREYRYISPEFQRDKAGRILRLDGAALVNRPALEELVALASQSRNDAAEPEPEAALIAQARELAAAAQVYQAEQARLGKPVTTATAVAAVQAQRASTSPQEKTT